MHKKNLLSHEEKKFLLNLARYVITRAANEENELDTPLFSPTLNEKFGVFVTLHINHQLRGCIGYVEGIVPLQKAVQDMATSAAFSDPRFEPVDKSEVPDLDIEISVLSPLRTIQDIAEIEVGIHGLVVEKGFYKGLLLPQVATEYNWDNETFLSQTCLKAGLPADAWRDKSVEIKIFSAEIFSEAEFRQP